MVLIRSNETAQTVREPNASSRARGSPRAFMGSKAQFTSFHLTLHLSLLNPKPNMFPIPWFHLICKSATNSDLAYAILRRRYVILFA